MFTALAVFETRAQLRRSAWRIGLLVLVAAPLAALLFERGRYATGIFGYAYFTSLALRMNLGMAEDRQTGHDLLMSNFASAQQRIIAKLSALLVREAVVFGLAAAVAIPAWGNLRSGLWYTLEFTLVAWLLLPIAVVVELATGMRTPGAVAILIAFVVTLLAVQNSSAVEFFRSIGVTQSVGSWAALGRLFATAAVAILLTLVFCSIWALARRETRA